MNTWHNRWALFALAALMALSLCAVPRAHAAYPEKPITMVIAYPPGGGADALGRVMAKNLEDVLGKSLVVVNRSGAGGTISAASVATSAADNYTIFFAESGLLVAPHLNPSLGVHSEQLHSSRPCG
ncbi:MAG: hypothetical protein IPI73_17675 [Betaproteobacteria bacterium]|nr:hypothetical protein [Betaproteobacteria bacterium]